MTRNIEYRINNENIEKFAVVYHFFAKYAVKISTKDP